MVDTIKRAWNLPDLRSRLLYTFMLLIIYRFGSAIVVPYINLDVLAAYIEANSVLGLLNVITGNNFKNFSVFAMGIQPYINASIIMNLLSMAIPALERLNKEGDAGQKKIAKYTKYVAAVLAIIQALGMTLGFDSFLTVDRWYVVVLITTIICAGTSFLMWLGEQITDKGIGNGISMIIFISIISGLPAGIANIYNGILVGSYPFYIVIVMLLFGLISIIGVVAVQEGTRKIPVSYAKRVVGRKMYGGRNTHLPMKVNQSGVIPIIFAQTLVLFPSQIAAFFPNNRVLASISDALVMTKPWTMVMYVVLIVAFTFFYTMVTFNPEEVAENLQQYGGFVPGIRSGKPTVTYLTRILNRLTLSGSLFLAMIAILPTIASMIIGTEDLQFTGTSLLIVVGVALETVEALEQHMIMRNYKGFLK
ncbi:MAG: preprotein translocase subunit SecY [Eubacteriaceae bacterium]|nr:preprotein translocase subunit SecY [Eubacteriaceae bacterium]